jgi:hypothetical protein
MLLARYWLAIPVLALAGALAAAKRVPRPPALPTHTLLRRRAYRYGDHRRCVDVQPALALGPSSSIYFSSPASEASALERIDHVDCDCKANELSGSESDLIKGVAAAFSRRRYQ